jgi:hypothetical protein
MKPKTIKQHEDEFIHVPKDHAQAIGLLALYAISGWMMWNILLIAADHKAELDGISWFALFANLGFALAYDGIFCGVFYLTLKLRGNNSLLLLLLLPLLLLPLLPLLLPPLLPLLLPPLLLLPPPLLLLLSS